MGWRRLALLAAITASCPAPAQAPATFLAPAEYPARKPDLASLAYAPAEGAGNGHYLDLYLPVASRASPAPIVIWTGGSAWLADNGRDRAGWLASLLVPQGFAVAGVSIRSSTQAPFPAQLHDIKAAIRWLRAHAAQYGLDGAHIGIVGDSSGGWTAAMAATTSGLAEWEGAGGSADAASDVQAAVAFYPPTDLLAMDEWALRPCSKSVTVAVGRMVPPDFCHDAATSPESRLVGCALQDCPVPARRASPVTYVRTDSPPMLILHGESDPLVPWNQGARLYQAFVRACGEATFVSVPKAAHGIPWDFLRVAPVSEGATIRHVTREGCQVAAPEPFQPSYTLLVDFLKRHLMPTGPALAASSDGARSSGH